MPDPVKLTESSPKSSLRAPDAAPPKAEERKRYCAVHRIVGVADGARKVWKSGDILSLTDAEAKNLRAAVEPARG